MSIGPDGFDKPMTVGEVIQALQEFPHDMEVLTEGCDCDGNVGSVCLYPYDGRHAYLRRPHYHYQEGK